MVLDAGIDPNHRAYKDKVISSYTLVCDSNASNSDTTKLSQEEIKEKILAGLKTGAAPEIERNCHLEKGINHVWTPPSPAVSALKAKWNQAIKNKNFYALPKQEAQQVKEYLEKGLSRHHGTNVTALIAYRNPNVRLILVEKKLGRSPTDGADPSACKSIEQVPIITSIMQDPEVKQAVLQYGKNSGDALIHQLAIQQHVSFINKSYGRDRTTIATFLAAAGCGGSEKTETVIAYLSEKESLRQTVNQNLGIGYDNAPYLTLQSAGNSGIPINTKRDRPDSCSGSTQHINVGSYDIGGRISYFSNYGPCVDLYSLGSSVITSSPDDFLTITNGTSFSAPLAIRYMTYEFSEKMPLPELNSKLRSRLDAKLFLPQSKVFQYAAYEAYPHELTLVGEEFDPTINAETPLDLDISQLCLLLVRSLPHPYFSTRKRQNLHPIERGGQQ